MNREWNDGQPIYRNYAIVSWHMILDGVLKKATSRPCAMSRPTTGVNPLTVLKAYQEWWTRSLSKSGEASGCS